MIILTQNSLMVSYCIKLGQKDPNHHVCLFLAPEKLLMLFCLSLLLFEMTTPHLHLPISSQALRSIVTSFMKPYLILQIGCDLFLLCSPMTGNFFSHIASNSHVVTGICILSLQVNYKFPHAWNSVPRPAKQYLIQYLECGEWPIEFHGLWARYGNMVS